MAPPFSTWGQTKPPRPACPVGALLMIAGGVVMIVGSFLTWFEIVGEEFNGFSELGDESRDGPVFVAFGLIMGGFGITTLAAKRLLPIAIIATVVASFSGLAALVDYTDVRDATDLGFGSTGPGLPVVLLGSLIGLAGGIVALATRRR